MRLPGGEIGAGDPPASEVGPLGDHHPAPGVELDPIRHPAGTAVNDRLARGRVKPPDVPRLDRPLLIAGDVREGDLAEVDLPIGGDGDPLGQHPPLEQFFELGVGEQQGAGLGPCGTWGQPQGPRGE